MHIEYTFFEESEHRDKPNILSVLGVTIEWSCTTEEIVLHNEENKTKDTISFIFSYSEIHSFVEWVTLMHYRGFNTTQKISTLKYYMTRESSVYLHRMCNDWKEGGERVMDQDTTFQEQYKELLGRIEAIEAKMT